MTPVCVMAKETTITTWLRMRGVAPETDTGFGTATAVEVESRCGLTGGIRESMVGVTRFVVYLLTHSMHGSNSRAICDDPLDRGLSALV